MARSKNLTAALNAYEQRRSENPNYTNTYDEQKIQNYASKLRQASMQQQQTPKSSVNKPTTMNTNTAGTAMSRLAADMAKRNTSLKPSTTRTASKTTTNTATNKKQDKATAKSQAKSKTTANISQEDFKKQMAALSGKNEQISNLDTNSYVANRVEQKKPSTLDKLKTDWKRDTSGVSTANTGRILSAGMKNSAGDPNTVYNMDNVSEDTRRAYAKAAAADTKNPMNMANAYNESVNQMNGNKFQDNNERNLGYAYMSEDEKNRYNEIYGMYGRDAAEDYKYRLQSELNARIATDRVANDKRIDNRVERGAYMFGQGVGSGLAGIGESAEWLMGIERQKPTSVSEYTASQIRQNEQNKAVGMMYDIAQSTGNMLPGMVASAVLPGMGVAPKAAQAAGSVMFGLSQAGNTYREDLNEGKDARLASIHAGQQAIDETATNWLLGGINAFGGGALKRLIGNSAVGRSVVNGIDKLAISPTGKVLLNRFVDMLGDMAGEGAQEYVQFYTDNFTRNLLYGESNSMNPLDKDAWYAAALGALNAGILNAPNYAAKISSGVSANVENAAETAESLDLDRSHYQSDEDFEKVETMQKVAEQVSKKVEAGTVTTADKIAYNEAFAEMLTIEDIAEDYSQEEDTADDITPNIAENQQTESTESTGTNETVDDGRSIAEEFEAAANGSVSAEEENTNSAANVQNVMDRSRAVENLNNDITSRNVEYKMPTTSERRQMSAYTAENSVALGTKESTDTMISMWDGRNKDRYLSAYKAAYTAGLNNVDAGTLMRLQSNMYLTEAQRNQAYKDGMKDSNRMQNDLLKVGNVRTGGIVSGENLLNNDQHKFLSWVGNKTGLRIEVTNDTVGNASIDLKNGVMKINPNSRDFVGTTGHELTHMIKQYAPKEYKKLQSIVIDSMMKSQNLSYEEMFAKYENAYREVHPDYTVDDIIEEMVADGSTEFMADPDFAERIAREDKSLATKIAEFFQDIADALKNLIAGRNSNQISKALRENQARYETAAATWREALTNASEKYKSGYIVKDTNRDKKHSLIVDKKIFTNEYFKENYYEVANMEYATRLTGNEFGKGDTKPFKEQIKDFYSSINNNAYNEITGNVILDNKFVKTDIGHGLGRLKAMAFKAVPDVIEKGKVVNYTEDYGKRGTDKIVIAAPIEVTGGEKKGEYYMAVAVEVTEDKNRGYLHEVAIKKIEHELKFNTPSIGLTPSRSSNDTLSIKSILNVLQSINGEDHENTMKILEKVNSFSNISSQQNSQASKEKHQLDIDDDTSYSNNVISNSSAEVRDTEAMLGELLSHTNYMPAAKSIEKIAKQIAKETDTTVPVTEIQENLKALYTAIAAAEHVDGRSMSEIAADYAGDLISNAYQKYTKDNEGSKAYRELRDALKNRKFHLPQGFEGELEQLGGVRALRKEFFGTLDITKNGGQSIDQLYKELNELNPGAFPDYIANPADQLEHIVDALRTMKPKVTSQFDGANYDYDAHRYFVGQMMFQGYINANISEMGKRSEFESLANKYKKENAELLTREGLAKADAADMAARYYAMKEAAKQTVSKQKMRDRVTEVRQSTKRSYYKNEIIKDTKQLSRWLLTPTDKNHVPESLRTTVADFLTHVDFSSRDFINDQTGDPTKRTLDWLKLKDTWTAIATSEGIVEDNGKAMYLNIDPDLMAKIDSLNEKMKDMKRMEDLDYIGLRNLSDIIKSMKHAIEGANELLTTSKYKEVSQAAQRTIDDMTNRKQVIEFGGATGTAQNLMGSQMLDATSQFHILGDAANDIYSGLRKGFNQKVRRTAEAADGFAKVLEAAGVDSKTINKWSGKRAETIKLNIGKGTKGADADGNVEFTIAQVMSLYELTKRPQAKDHMEIGGIAIDRTERKGKLLSKYKKSETMKLKPAQIGELIAKLTPEQRRVADGIAGYFQTTAQWGNNASMQLYGYKKFNDPHYFPIWTDKNYIHRSTDAAAMNTNAVAIQHLGSTKATTPHANNPIIIADIFDVFTEQVNDMSNYEAFAAPLADYNKWYNYVDNGASEVFETDSVTGQEYRRTNTADKYSGSVKKAIETTRGKDTIRWMNKFIEDINGMGGSETYFGNGLVSKFKGAAVGANLSVVVQQPTAYARAMAVMDAKYLMKALTSKAEVGTWEDVKKYSSIAQWKDWGFNQMDTGKTMRNILIESDRLGDKLQDLQMKPAGKGDEVAWYRLWIAAELQVKAEQKNLKVGSEEFFKATAEVFDNIIDTTQVVDSVFHRADIMRSKNDLTKMSTSFMSEPMKSWNMLYRATYDLVNAKGAEAKKVAGKTLMMSGIAWITSQALAAAAKSVVTTMRDNDDEREENGFANRWVMHFKDEFLGNIAPWNYVPFLRDIASIIQGYTVARTDVTFIQDMMYAYTRWEKFFNGESKYTLANNVLYSTKAISDMTGIAIYGFQRDVNVVINTAIELSGSAEVKYQKDKLVGMSMKNSANLNHYIAMAMRAYKDGNTALGDKIIEDLKRAGNEQEDIDKKLSTAYKKEANAAIEENAEELNDILAGIASGSDTKELEAYADKLKAAGQDPDSVDSAITTSLKNYITEEYSYATLNEHLNEITDYSKEGFKDIEAEITSWANLSKVKNGWDDKECRSALKNNYTNYFKDLYEAGGSAERSRILNILTRVKINGEYLYTEKEIKKWVK